MNSNSSREEVWSSQTLLLDLDMEGAPLFFFGFGDSFLVFFFGSVLKGRPFFCFGGCPTKIRRFLGEWFEKPQWSIGFEVVQIL